MARLYASGFEFNSLTAGEEWDSITGSPTISSSIYKGGSYALRANANNAYVKKAVYYTNQNIRGYIKANVYFAAFPTSGFVEILSLATSTSNTTSIGLDSNGKLGIYSAGSLQGTPGSTLNTGQWYTIELYGGASVGGTYELKVDGSSYKTETFTNNSLWSHIMAGLLGTANSADIYIDDVVYDDAAFPGIAQLDLLLPASAGDSTQWTPSTGSNYACVDDGNPDDSDYVSTTATSKIDLYNVTAMTGTPDTIYYVYVGARHSTTNQSFCKISIDCKEGGSTSTSGFLAQVPSAFKSFPDGSGVHPNYKLVMSTKPSGGSWTKSTVEASQIGVTSSISFSNTAKVSAMWAYVEFLPQTVQSVSVSDTATVTESVNVALVHTINKNDTVTVTESVSVFTALNIGVNDTVTITENVTVRGELNINKSESITLTESVSMNCVNFINVSDSITVTESVALTQVYTVNVNDSVTITESVTARSDLNPNVSDTVTVTEGLTPLNTKFINVNDSITLTESVSMNRVNFINVSDLVTVTDVPNVALVQQINKSESITITESVTVRTELNLSVNDSITVTDVPNVALVQQINKSESITITESVTVRSDENVSVSDSITLTESVNVNRIFLINVSDSVTVTDVPNVALVQQINVYDEALFDEFYAVSIEAIELSMDRSDSVTVSESVTVRTELNPNINDAITVSESVSMNRVNFISVSDSVTVTDVPNVALVQQINVNDLVTISEFIDLDLDYGSQGNGENITVTDVPNVALVQQINVSDSVTVTDVPSFATGNFINVSDTATVTDVPNVALAQQVSVNDSVTVTDSPNVALVQQISVDDSITITESVDPDYHLNLGYVAFADFEGTLDGFALNCGGVPTSSYDDGIVPGEQSVKLWSTGGDGLACMHKKVITDLRSVSIGTSVFVWSKGYSRFMLWNSTLGRKVTGTYTRVKTGATYSGASNTLYSIFNGGLPYDNWELFKFVTSEDTGTDTIRLYCYNNGQVGESKASWYDKITLRDHSEAVGVQESITMMMGVSINVSDSITVTDIPNTALAQQISMSDAVTVSESNGSAQALQIAVFDEVTVTDGIGRTSTVSVSVNESVTLTESVNVVPSPIISSYDEITVTDTPSVLIPFLLVAVSDSITVTDISTMETVSYVSVNDSITVTESRNVNNVFQINVNDTVAISESQTLLIPELFASLTQTIVVSESVTVWAGYTFTDKNTTIYTNTSKNSASYSNLSKNSASYSNLSKNSASYSNLSKDSSSWDYLDKTVT